MAREAGRVDFVASVIQTILRPVEIVSGGIADGIANFTFGLVEAPRLTQENARLRALLASQAMYQERIDSLEADVDSLRKMSGLGELPGKTRLTAQVIAFSVYENRVILDAGEKQGVQPGMPVITGDGLVGVVQTVSRGQCQVRLITNIDTQIGAIDISRKPPAMGFLRGRGTSTLVLTLFDPKAPIASGDVIVTSGQSDRIPRRIIIGRVISVTEDLDLGTQRATIDPAMNVGTLREVQILK